ncbi:bone morphogenetic protein 2-like [Saccoglossus kowalevskii]
MEVTETSAHLYESVNGGLSHDHEYNLQFKVEQETLPRDIHLTAAEIILNRKRKSIGYPYSASIGAATEQTMPTYNIKAKQSGPYDVFDVSSDVIELDTQHTDVPFKYKLHITNGSGDATLDKLYHFKENTDRSPLLVLYFGIRPDDVTGKRKSDFSSVIVKRSPPSKSKLREECKLYHWTVSFQDLGWNWIIRPKTVAANYCAGRCPYILKATARYNNTNNSYVRNILRSRYRQRQSPRSIPPRASCVPTVLKPISILFRTPGNSIGLETMEDMQASMCGCM